ncbi:MAG: bifunctional [glutamine synthetase] adenylyltransferase/[glutamine synthetase]-adenylyl-L-tyrosine phosphorylase [Pseudomonadota bacterium]
MATRDVPLSKACLPNHILGVWQTTDKEAFTSAIAAQNTALFENAALVAAVNACAAHAPFLRDLLQRHVDFLSNVVDWPPQNVVRDLIERTDTGFDSQIALRSGLRITRQKLMLYLAIADCAQTIRLQTLTAALSSFAEASLTAALRFELAQWARAGKFDPERAQPEACGLAILGLGKLGGQELNFSSDIDLMIFFEEEKFAYTGHKDLKTAATTLTRAVCGHLTAKTSDGFVFRVDLRLRPNPSSMPIAITLDAAESYYQTVGQTWERAALIKARCCAGDAGVAYEFFSRIRPFVWRRHLDFAAIDDVRAMKERVHKHHRHDVSETPGPGFDVKLGYGGIREIEFFAQIHQLINGGKRPELQLRATCDVLRQLAQCGDITQSDADALVAAYFFLRGLEHRLQMMHDAQTHTLPDTPAQLEIFARFMGHSNVEGVIEALHTHTGKVKHIFQNLLGAQETSNVALPVAIAQDDKAQQILTDWASGPYRALRSERAQRLLNLVLPDLLTAFAATPDPLETLIAFDGFVAQLPAGIQVFSLLNANRALIRLLASVMGHSPELRTQIGRRPDMFEGLIAGDLYRAPPERAGLEEDLQNTLERASDYEAVLDITRIWNNETRFRLGVQVLEGLRAPLDAAQGYTDVAQVCIETLYRTVVRNFQQTYGTIDGGEFAVLALGSFGAHELTTGSDLDLTFLYRTRQTNTSSDGAKPLPAGQYYARLAQRFISAITGMTGEGRLYDIDMRLRPSGRSGVIATSFDAFLTYYQESAWLYERMSLTKARVITGNAALMADFEAARSDILSASVPGSAVERAIWNMRRRLHEASHGAIKLWDLKAGDGGLRDADFLAEGLALKEPAAQQESNTLTRWPDWWHRAARAHAVADDQIAEIAAAQQTLIKARIVKKLLISNAANMADAPRAAQQKLAQLVGAEDFAAAQDGIQHARLIIWQALNRLLPAP